MSEDVKVAADKRKLSMILSVLGVRCNLLEYVEVTTQLVCPENQSLAMN